MVHEDTKPAEHIKIDYIFTNRKHMKAIVNCKAILDVAMVSQHRLVMRDLRTRPRKKSRYRQENEVRIKWWRHKDQVVAC